MKRIQLYIQPELDQRLKDLALRRHLSKARLLREGAQKLLDEAELGAEDSIMDIIDIGRGGPGNVSEEHDKYLMELELRRSHG